MVRGSVSDQARWQILSVLRPAEVLNWMAVPVKRRAVVYPAVQIVFMFFWLTFAISLFVVAASEFRSRPDNILMLAISVCSVGLSVFGVVVLISSVWRAVAACFTVYALTNQRLIVRLWLWPFRTWSYDASWYVSSEVRHWPLYNVIRLKGRQSRQLPAILHVYVAEKPELIAQKIRDVLCP